MCGYTDILRAPNIHRLLYDNTFSYNTINIGLNHLHASVDKIAGYVSPQESAKEFDYSLVGTPSNSILDSLQIEK